MYMGGLVGGLCCEAVLRGGAAKCRCCGVGVSVLRRRRLSVEASAPQG